MFAQADFPARKARERGPSLPRHLPRLRMMSVRDGRQRDLQRFRAHFVRFAGRADYIDMCQFFGYPWQKVGADPHNIKRINGSKKGMKRCRRPATSQTQRLL